MISIQLTTPPEGYPLTLAEARAQLGIETQEYDARLAAMLAAATAMTETYLGRALITRTYTGFLDTWPWRSGFLGPGPALTGRLWLGGVGVLGWGARHLELPRAPLQAVAYVKTYDDTDTPTTWAPANYYVDTASFVGRLVLRTAASWPVPTRAANGVEIQWTAGMGDNPADIPDDIRAGVLVTMAALNEQRGDEAAPPAMPPAAAALLAPHKLFNF